MNASSKKALVVAGAVLLACLLLLENPAVAQAPSSASPVPTTIAPPPQPPTSPPPGGYPPDAYPPGSTPPAPGYPPASTAPAPGYPPGSGPPAPGYPPGSSAPGATTPPAGYPASGYPPPAAGPPSPYPPATQPGALPGASPGTPGYAPPGYRQSYPPPPGYGIIEPPLPPKRAELQWSLRFNVFDLIFGKVSGEIEYAFAGPLSVVIGPEYTFADPRQDSSLGVTASGVGLYGELGWWIEGRPLRGYFLKAHLAHRSIIFHSDSDRLVVPETLLGAMFGSQSIYAGWFSLSGGFGVAFDFNSKERRLHFSDPTQGGADTFYVLQETGPFHNGFDLITQLSLGGSF